MLRTKILAAALCLGTAGCVSGAQVGAEPGPSSAASDLFDAQGYRAQRYRAPVDRLPEPARRIALDEALRLAPGKDALFLDVLPVESGWRDPQTGVWLLSVPHATIPHAHWHPETGRSAPDRALWDALRADVRRWRRDHPRAPVVLFCRADCWMSWNAARRLAREGIAHVTWLEEGIEGWRGAGRQLDVVAPVTVAPRP